MSAAIEELIRETLERRGSVEITSEVLHDMCGVRVVADTEDGTAGVVRQFPGVFLSLAVDGVVKLDGRVVARFVGNLDALQRLCARNRWVCTPLSAEKATAAITRAP